LQITRPNGRPVLIPAEFLFQFSGNLKNQMIFAGMPCQLDGAWMLPII
jgi:hypothetical protein